MNQRRILQTCIGIGTVAALLFAFNNCGKVFTGEFESDHLQPLATKVSNLKATYQGNLSQNFCFESKNYSCVHKVFSSTAESQDLGVSSEECVNLSSGGQVCPETHHYVLNSQAAKEACKENCQESYDFQDYDCNLKLAPSKSGVYPLVVTTDNLEGAIEELHRACQDIQKGQ